MINDLLASIAETHANEAAADLALREEMARAAVPRCMKSLTVSAPATAKLRVSLSSATASSSAASSATISATISGTAPSAAAPSAAVPAVTAASAAHGAMETISCAMTGGIVRRVRMADALKRQAASRNASDDEMETASMESSAWSSAQ